MHRISVVGGLAVVLVALLIGEFYTTRLEHDRSPTISKHSSLTDPVRSPPRAAPDLQSNVDVILARPLFSETRRPLPVVASARSVLPRLSGILVSSHSKTLIFSEGSNGKSIALSEGERIGVYIVQSIVVGEATLLGPDGAWMLRPSFDSDRASSSTIEKLSVLESLRQNLQPSASIPGLLPLQGTEPAAHAHSTHIIPALRHKLDEFPAEN